MREHAHQPTSFKIPVMWGVLFGAINLAAPLIMWWLNAATVHALAIALIAAVYIGFAVADGRPHIIAVEVIVASVFVVLAAIGVTASAWVIVLAYAGHGAKDLWQERRHFVAGTRWWPPFCCAVDWVVAAGLAVLIVVGVNFHS
jgi:hypothetical protein